MENPFKFGSLVDGKYFTDRVKEQDYLKQILNSPNHAVLISPRRFGKSSLVAETLRGSKREIISLNFQAITSSIKLAEAIYRKFFARHPLEKAKHYLSSARIIPTFSLNPMTGTPEVSLQPGANKQVALEDAFALLEKAGKEKRLIVVMDEFQEIMQIEKGLDKILRSIMQEQENINYILMGSRENMMKKIFLRKKSPFYHFGALIYLDRIPYGDFKLYISERLVSAGPVHSPEELADGVLAFTNCHPYYTQQLAFQVWYEIQRGIPEDRIVENAIQDITQMHDFDYSRLWETMNTTNKIVLSRIALGGKAPMESPELPTSTIFSALNRLVDKGILIKNGKYTFDDPFFCKWVKDLT